ncbi:MAG: hypothetical protein A4E28_00507 [Methanocella sp. PtaU1.Bin125]|nr:MAG: hypothetical protein A4E28_00507 [Methanocella sp. PtaU1.Bin125]
MRFAKDIGANAYRLTALLAVTAAAVAVSGCICCCGLDGYFSKMKGPVTDIAPPGELSVGGKSYTLQYSYDYLNRSAAKAGFRAFIPRIGYSPDMYGRSVDQMMDVGAVDQYKWFEYNDASGRAGFGGFLAKAGSPFVVDSGIHSLNSMLGVSMGIINDPYLNQGGASNLTKAGTTKAGGGGDLYRFTADYNGTVSDCYFVMGRYSNMYVAVYSFESFEVAENVTEQAVAWIDMAASS